MGMTPDDPEVEELRKAFIAINDGLYALPLNLPFTHYSKALKVNYPNLSVVFLDLKHMQMKMMNIFIKVVQICWCHHSPEQLILFGKFKWFLFLSMQSI
jgi:hypothetical protein